jgi:hypothetical protein
LSAFLRMISLSLISSHTAVSKLFEPIERRSGPFHIEESATLKMGDRRSAFHLRSPPHERVRISTRQRLQ